MKTAISLPDDLFAIAERYAAATGMSRSQLYATALREYLRANRLDSLTERINDVCDQVDTALPPDLARSARRRLLEMDW